MNMAPSGGLVAEAMLEDQITIGCPNLSKKWRRDRLVEPKIKIKPLNLH